MVLRGFLKFLAAFLAVVLILALILGFAGYFAFRNFDPNMFRAELEKHLTQQTGFRVELGDIQVQWRPQPGVRVAGLKLFHPESLDLILQSDQVRIDLDLTSIWQKQLSMSEVVIQSPEVFLRRDRGGAWNWQPAKPSGVPVAPSAPLLSQLSLIPNAEASEGAETRSLKDLRHITQGWEFGIGKILVRGATVHFADETSDPAFGLEIEKLDAEVRQKAVGLPFYFTAGGSVFNSAKRNLEAEGELDLTTQSLDFLLRYGPEKAAFKGKLILVGTLPRFSGTLEIRDLDMDSVIPAVYKQKDYVAGQLSANANLSLEGANPEKIQRSLDGQGTLGIKNGALKNRNLIKEVFDRLTPVVAVTSALGGELPPELHEMLKGSDTPFDSLHVAYAVQAGIFKVSEFRLTHPSYQLAGQGTYGLLDKRVDGAMQLVLSPSISGYLIKKIREMQLIADRSGQIMIPFRYTGLFPDAVVQPDLGYLGARLLQGGADQLLNRGLESLSKVLGAPKSGQTTATDPAISQDPQTGSSKAQLIQHALELFSQYQEGEKT